MTTNTNYYSIGTPVIVSPEGLYYGYGKTRTEQFGTPEPFFAYVSATSLDGTVSSVTRGPGHVHEGSFGHEPMRLAPEHDVDPEEWRAVLVQLRDDARKRSTWATIAEVWREHLAHEAAVLDSKLSNPAADDGYFCHSTSCPADRRGPFASFQRAALHELSFHNGAQTCWTPADILASEGAADSAAGPRGAQ